MFIDEVTIKIIDGAGDSVYTAFLREKFQMGGPFCGNGDHGSIIVFKVYTGLHTLFDLHYMKTIKGNKEKKV